MQVVSCCLLAHWPKILLLKLKISWKNCDLFTQLFVVTHPLHLVLLKDDRIFWAISNYFHRFNCADFERWVDINSTQTKNQMIQIVNGRNHDQSSFAITVVSLATHRPASRIKNEEHFLLPQIQIQVFRFEDPWIFVGEKHFQTLQ